MGKALNYLGIARMSGNIELGEENAKALVKAGKARLLVVASDTSDAAKQRAEGYIYGFRTPLTEVPFTKAEIAAAVGKAGCNMAAFRDLGLAKSFAQALAAEYGERYAPLAAQLDEKAERAKARKSKGGKTGNRRKCE